MKITKSELEQIIQETISDLVKEEELIKEAQKGQNKDKVLGMLGLILHATAEKEKAVDLTAQYIKALLRLNPPGKELLEDFVRTDLQKIKKSAVRGQEKTDTVPDDQGSVTQGSPGISPTAGRVKSTRA